MKKLSLIILVLNLLACNQSQEQSLPSSPVVATVGEEKVTVDLLNSFLQANGINKTDDALLKKALESLTVEIAIARIAKNKNIQLTTEQLNTLKYLKIKTHANNAKSDYLSNKKITEEEILQEYQRAQKQVGTTLYHIHHLLYKDEVEAIKNLDELRSVEDYKMLELLYSQQKPNMKGVGDLGWVSLGQLPEGFREPLSKAQPGSLLKQVVNSKFGAHIVYFEEQKEQKPPPLEQVREGIIKTLKAKQLSKFVQLAKAKAKISIRQ